MKLTVALLGALVAVLLGCSAADSAATDTNGDSNSTVVLGNPGTLVPPTTQPSTDEQAENLLPIETIVAFLDACVADSGLVGPCHCAADRLEGSFTPQDIEIFEDRITGQLEYPPQVASDLVSCQNASPPAAWDETMRRSYVAECAKGADQLTDLCMCSLMRAQDVIPGDRLAEYLASVEARPDFADLINRCV